MIAQGLSLEDVLAAEEAARQTHYFTTFQHLDVHHGFRPGVISGYIGSTGCGKSSLMKTLAMQAASTGPDTKVLYWLSEESAANYGKAMVRYASTARVPLDRIRFFEESSLDHTRLRTHEQFLDAFRDVVAGEFANIVFIDNCTTSRLYNADTGFRNQGKTVEFLKNLAKDLNIAIVYLAHTAANVSDNQGRLITTEDIRGSKDLVIQTSYFYILQKFTKNTDIFLTLRTVKFRDHQNAAGCYLLKYDSELGVYTGDVKVDFEKINQIFKDRDYLGRK